MCESMCSQCKNGSKSGDKDSKSSEGKASKSGGKPSKDGDPSEGSGQTAKEAAEVLSEMEMLNELMKDAESARSQCQGGSNPSDKPGKSSMNASGEKA